jgi:DNA-binding transcriptional regulator LsrR (DeoR family)
MDILPVEVVGDVGFWPIDEEGNVVEIFDKKGKKLRVYSLITPEIMKELAGGGGIVILIARNHRHNDEVSKTVPIRAAIRGGFGNVIITDEYTANEIIREPL